MEVKKKPNYYLYFIIISGNIMSFTTGLAFSWTSPAIPRMNGSVDPENNPLSENLTPSQEAWLIGILSLGIAIGVWIFGKLSDIIGRKTTFYFYVFPVTACFLIKAFANDVGYMYAARFIGGLGMGSGYAVFPIYTGEVAEDCNRGKLSSLMILFSSGGILFSYCVGPFLTIMWFSILCAIPGIVFLIILLIYIPESPYYLASKGRIEEARSSLKIFRKQNTATDIEKEFQLVIENIKVYSTKTQNVLEIFATKGFRRGISITLILMVVQQCSGMSILLMNLQSTFQTAGSSLRPELSAIIVGVLQFISCFSSPIFIEKCGRKLLLFISTFFTALSQAVMGVYFYLKIVEVDIGSIEWLPLASLLMFTIALNAGLNPVPWVYIGELFPLNISSLASTATTFTHLSLAFLTNIIFPYLVDLVGMAAMFWIFSGFCAIGFAFVFFFIPETKGLSLQEIQVILNK